MLSKDELQFYSRQLGIPSWGAQAQEKLKNSKAFVAGTGGSRSGLAYELLQAGYQLNVPRVFAALTLITAVGILLYAATTLAARWALRHWHESELAR